jgi:pimeloyl-ACP methyl ester carboxylesterase
MIAQALAVSRPDLVSRLILVATACKSPPAAREHMEGRIAALANIGPEAAARVAAESIFSKAWREANPAELERFLHWRCMAPAAPLTSAMRAVYDFDVSAHLPRIGIPTLVVSGSADTLIKPEATAEIAALIPGATLETIESAGHIIPVEAPDAFAKTLQDFLRR